MVLPLPRPQSQDSGLHTATPDRCKGRRDVETGTRESTAVTEEEEDEAGSDSYTKVGLLPETRRPCSLIPLVSLRWWPF